VVPLNRAASGMAWVEARLDRAFRLHALNYYAGYEKVAHTTVWAKVAHLRL
jgi:hypothetical protein